MVDCESYAIYLEWVVTVWEPKHDFYTLLAEECAGGFYCGSTRGVGGIVRNADGNYT